MYAVKNRQSKERHSVPPNVGKTVKERNQRGGGAPHCFHHCSGISQLHCDGKVLPQVGERLGFPSDLFEIATHSLE